MVQEGERNSRRDVSPETDGREYIGCTGQCGSWVRRFVGTKIARVTRADIQEKECRGASHIETGEEQTTVGRTRRKDGG